jgi:hypothetical protein
LAIQVRSQYREEILLVAIITVVVAVVARVHDEIEAPHGTFFLGAGVVGHPKAQQLNISFIPLVSSPRPLRAPFAPVRDP